MSKLDFDSLLANQLDFTQPDAVEIVISQDRKTLWVNINNVCVLRCCHMTLLNLDIPLELVMKGKVYTDCDCEACRRRRERRWWLTRTELYLALSIALAACLTTWFLWELFH